jgi:hypothetical protein
MEKAHDFAAIQRPRQTRRQVNIRNRAGMEPPLIRIALARLANRAAKWLDEGSPLIRRQSATAYA